MSWFRYNPSMSRYLFWWLQILMVVILMGLFVTPRIIDHLRSPGSLPMMISNDEGKYDAGVRAALLGRFSEVRNGMTGPTVDGPPAQGASPALLEMIVGAAFERSGLHAPQVMTLLIVLLTPFIVLLLVGLLRLTGCSRAAALVGTGVYVFVFLSALQKPINMSLSLPFTVLTLLLVLLAWRQRAWEHVIVAGVLLGLLPWVYFWSWTYVWAVVGWLVVLSLLQRQRNTSQTRPLLLMSAIAILVAAPFLLGLLAEHGNTLFAEAAVRSTLVHSRGVESVPRFLLSLLLLTGTLGLAVRSRRHADHWLVPTAFVLGGFTAMYQNLVHGVILSFSSHYYPFVCLSALVTLLWAIEHTPRSWWRYPVIVAGATFLIAGVWDYRAEWHIVRADYYLRSINHLGPAMQLLDDGKRETVLTDRVSAHMITSWTDDDVVFTAYVRHLIVSDTEYVERFCLSELMNPAGPDLTWLAHEVVEIPSVHDYAAREAQFRAACTPVRAHPKDFLKKYRVTKLLWNETLRPEWKINAALFKKEISGSGWSLWILREKSLQPRSG